VTKKCANGKRQKWVWASWHQWVIALAATAAVIAADQISKALVVANLKLHEWVTLIDPFLKVTYLQNEQGIFSISYGPGFLYVILSSIAMGFVIFLLLRPQSRFVSVLLGLILGGGFSNNLIDRIRLGYVIDGIDMGLRNWRFGGVYNIADASVVISVILLLACEPFSAKKGNENERPEKP